MLIDHRILLKDNTVEMAGGDMYCKKAELFDKFDKFWQFFKQTSGS